MIRFDSFRIQDWCNDSPCICHVSYCFIASACFCVYVHHTVRFDAMRDLYTQSKNGTLPKILCGYEYQYYSTDWVTDFDTEIIETAAQIETTANKTTAEKKRQSIRFILSTVMNASSHRFITSFKRRNWICEIYLALRFFIFFVSVFLFLFFISVWLLIAGCWLGVAYLDFSLILVVVALFATSWRAFQYD